MRQLFKAETIPQFKIMQFLTNEGVQPEMCQAVVFPDRDSVRITDMQGSTMTVRREAPGKYLFSYLINGDSSSEYRYDHAEYVGDTAKEAAS